MTRKKWIIVSDTGFTDQRREFAKTGNQITEAMNLPTGVLIKTTTFCAVSLLNEMFPKTSSTAIGQTFVPGIKICEDGTFEKMME